jgi:hypothetical protein
MAIQATAYSTAQKKKAAMPPWEVRQGHAPAHPIK